MFLIKFREGWDTREREKSMGGTNAGKGGKSGIRENFGLKRAKYGGAVVRSWGKENKCVGD